VPLGGARETCDGSFGRASDMAGQDRHRARDKGGGHGASLELPVFALAEQQAVAEQRTQDPHRCGGTAVVILVLDEDMMDRGRSIEDDLLAAEKVAMDHFVLKGLRRKGQEGVVAQCLGDNSPQERAGRRSGRRKDQRLRLGHSDYRLVVMR